MVKAGTSSLETLIPAKVVGVAAGALSNTVLAGLIAGVVGKGFLWL